MNIIEFEQPDSLGTGAILSAMNEWAKAAISTFLGFIAGLLAEPLKAFFETLRKRKLVRRLIYRDLANAEFAMKSLGSLDWATYEKERPGDLRFSDLRSDVFEWAYGTEKATFYGLDEFQALIFIYKQIRRIADFSPGDHHSYSVWRQELTELVNLLHQLLDSNSLDRKAFESAKGDLAILIASTSPK